MSLAAQNPEMATGICRNPMSPISLVLFDVNGVLYHYDKAARVAHLARLTGQQPAAVDRALWGSGFEDRGDAGEMDAGFYLRGFGACLGHPLTVDEWTDALLAALTPIPAMLALAERVGRRARLGILTNNNLLVRDRIDLLFPQLRPLFAGATCVSSEFGVRKPEPEVYRRCVARLGALPEQSLFIDDSAANVAGAEQAGLRGYRHTDEAALAARLAPLGLL
jgi:HAD superfamily hydrolase (TIGR01509 family)